MSLLVRLLSQFPVFPIRGQQPFERPQGTVNETRTFLPIPTAGGISVTIGQAVETDTASALTVTLTQHPSVKPIQYQPYERPQVPNKPRLYFRAGTTITIGQAVETDTASALTVVLTQHPTVEPTTGYQPYERPQVTNKTRLYARYGTSITIGQAVETDTASALTVTTTEHPSIKPIQAKQPFTYDQVPNKTRLYSRYGISITLGQAVETDTAQSISVSTQDHPAIKALQPISAHQRDQLPNKSRFFVFPPPGAITININQVVETDTASALTVTTSERPSVEPITYKAYERPQVPNLSRIVFRPSIIVSIGQAVETDTASALTVTLTQHPSTTPLRAIAAHQKDQLPNKSRLYSRYGTSISINQVVETDTASPITVTTQDHPAKLTYAKSFTYNQVPNKSRLIVQKNQTITIGQAVEFDSAAAVSSTGQFNTIKATVTKTYERPQVPNRSRLVYRLATSVNVNQAVETDSAQAISVTTTEHPAARAIHSIPAHQRDELPNKSRLYSRRGYTNTVGQTVETDTAQPIKANQSRTIGTAIEIDTAGQITVTQQDRPCTVNKGRKPFDWPPLPNNTRLIQVIFPDTPVTPLPIEPTPISAGVRPTRIRTKVGREVASAGMATDQISTHEGGAITEAELDRIRIETDS